MNRVRKQIGVEERGFPNISQYVTVAVLDSGVAIHPDLYHRVLVFRDFVHRARLFYDDNGHGTHICGIICGSGRLSNGKYRGIAENCRLVVGKVLDEDGNGDLEDMLEGIEWVLQMKDLLNIRILNISVGIGDLKDTDKTKLLQQKIKQVWESGILVICAAGNKGPEENSVSDIGGNSKTIIVGCHDGEYYRLDPNRCETYSGSGGKYDVDRKPDIVAPGTEIISCNAAYFDRGISKQPPYVKKNGTSMATALCSGAAALTLGKYPDMTNEEFRMKLHLTAKDLGLPWNRQGYGMLNLKGLLNG